MSFNVLPSTAYLLYSGGDEPELVSVFLDKEMCESEVNRDKFHPTKNLHGYFMEEWEIEG